MFRKVQAVVFHSSNYGDLQKRNGALKVSSHQREVTTFKANKEVVVRKIYCACVEPDIPIEAFGQMLTYHKLVSVIAQGPPYKLFNHNSSVGFTYTFNYDLMIKSPVFLCLLYAIIGEVVNVCNSNSSQTLNIWIEFGYFNIFLSPFVFALFYCHCKSFISI